MLSGLGSSTSPAGLPQKRGCELHLLQAAAYMEQIACIRHHSIPASSKPAQACSQAVLSAMALDSCRATFERVPPLTKSQHGAQLHQDSRALAEAPGSCRVLTVTLTFSGRTHRIVKQHVMGRQQA